MTSFAATGNSLFASSGGTSFADDNSGGVFLSTDGGDHWNPVNTGLSELDIRSIRVNGTYIYATTQTYGVWRRPLSEVLTEVNSTPRQPTPLTFALEQYYPNPFNPSTRIGFQINDYRHVTLKVYDVPGREVRTLVNEELKAGS